MPCTVLNWPSPLPYVPYSFSQVPSAASFTTRELLYPSAMKMLPSGPQATSVGRL